MTLGEKIRKLRLEKDKTQLEVAKYVGVNYQTVYKYEKDIAVPSIDTLKNIANFFNVTTDYLLGLDDKTKQEILEEPLRIAASMQKGLYLPDVDEEEKELIIATVRLLKSKRKEK